MLILALNTNIARHDHRYIASCWERDRHREPKAVWRPTPVQLTLNRRHGQERRARISKLSRAHRTSRIWESGNLGEFPSWNLGIWESVRIGNLGDLQLIGNLGICEILRLKISEVLDYRYGTRDTL